MRRWLWLSLALAVAAFGLSLEVWYFHFDELPALVPTHWNIHGDADAWRPREDMFGVFLLLPGVMAGWVGLTLLLPWLSPAKFKVDSFRSTYGYLMFLIQGMFLYIHGVVLLGSLEAPLDVGRVLVAGICLFLALTGNVLGKVRRNFWMGVRTPWTLADERVWERTHRLAAWLFVAGGLFGCLGALLGLNLIVCFVGVMVAALVPVVYSLVIYKRLEREGRLAEPVRHAVEGED
jgi:uncharacterized membrane protein